MSFHLGWELVILVILIFYKYHHGLPAMAEYLVSVFPLLVSCGVSNFRKEFSACCNRTLKEICGLAILNS